MTPDESYIMSYNSTNLLLLVMDKCEIRQDIFNNSFEMEKFDEFTGVLTVQVPASQCQGNTTNCIKNLKYPSWKKDTQFDSRICRSFNVNQRAAGYDCQIRQTKQKSPADFPKETIRTEWCLSGRESIRLKTSFVVLLLFTVYL